MGLFLFLAWDWCCARDHEDLIPESLFSSSPVPIFNLDFFVSVGVGGAKAETSTDSKHRYLDSAWDQSRYSNLVIV